MEWIERLNETINYIEEHLTDEIDYEELAKIAGCSTYHFQRMFAYMADVSLSEYIRRRKLSDRDQLIGTDGQKNPGIFTGIGVSKCEAGAFSGVVSFTRS